MNEIVRDRFDDLREILSEWRPVREKTARRRARNAFEIGLEAHHAGYGGPSLRPGERPKLRLVRAGE